MLSELMEQGIFTGVVAICGCSLLIRLLLDYTYRSLLRAAADMGHSSHRLMKVLCMKFETCYQLKIGVPNVEVFVEKYLRHYRVLGLHIKTWEQMNMLSVILVIVSSMGTSIWRMAEGKENLQVFFPLLAGVLGTGVLLLMDFIWDTEAKWKMLQVDITDYLENICKPRMENQVFHPTEMEEYRKKYFVEEDKVLPFEERKNEKKEEDGFLKDFSFTEEEESVIREVIQEYLG